MSAQPDAWVLVTGATRGIGLAIAARLVASGRKVLGVYRRDEVAAEVAQKELGPGFRAVRVDALATALEAVPALAGAVLNAGVVLRGPFTELEHEGVDPIEMQLEADLGAPLRLCRTLLREGRLIAGSSLVFVGSNAARRGLAGMVAYSAAKAGLEGATRALARELGPQLIRVNAVAPGVIRTDMTRSFGDVGYQAYAAEVPLGRVGEAQDVAPAVEFLLGDGARYITGQVLDIDGGWAC